MSRPSWSSDMLRGKYLFLTMQDLVALRDVSPEFSVSHQFDRVWRPVMVQRGDATSCRARRWKAAVAGHRFRLVLP